MNKEEKEQLAMAVRDLENKFQRTKEDTKARRDSSILNYVENTLLNMNDSTSLTRNHLRAVINDLCVYIDKHRYGGD